MYTFSQINLKSAQNAARIQQEFLINMIMIVKRSKTFYRFVSDAVENYAEEHKGEKNLGEFYDRVKQATDWFCDEYTKCAVRTLNRFTLDVEEMLSRKAIFSNPARDALQEMSKEAQ